MLAPATLFFTHRGRPRVKFKFKFKVQIQIIFPAQALQIWHVVLTAQTASGHAESGAAASLERGSAALDAVLARYGCHPLDQDVGLDALASDYVEEEDSGEGRSAAEVNPQLA